MWSHHEIEVAYQLARQRYAELGVDVEAAVANLKGVCLSLHCWQGDDVTGFEAQRTALGGGLAVTGAYPGRARNPDELRQDIAQALSLIPGRHRLNLHAMYAETGGRPVDRDELAPEHFSEWIAWGLQHCAGLDFNPTFFSHRMAELGFTLSHPDAPVRDFWIRHGIRCREIAAVMGGAFGSPCVVNFWIPDGFKDTPADRSAPRARLADALDAIFAVSQPAEQVLDAVEGKLFGIGSECYVVGSHEFYLGYALARGKMLCLDAGHFHPTESVADKISAVLQFMPRLLLHISRPQRWDSDHVVTNTDELAAISRAVVHDGYLNRVHLGLDYFDASINRVAAWVIGARSTLKAILAAMLDPVARIRAAEAAGDYTARLALQEEAKSLPAGAVWDYYCLRQDVPIGERWIDDVRCHERAVQSRRL